MKSATVLGVRIAATDLAGARAHVVNLVEAQSAAYVCCANVHLVELAQRDESVRRALAGADLVVADGAPIAWAARGGERVTGSDLFAALNEGAARAGHRVFLLGSTDETLAELRASLEADHPTIQIVGTHSPPFGDAAALDVTALAELLNRASPDLVWIGLGAPKQELAMEQLRPMLSRGVMVGVGAVFDFASGRRQRAPVWLQKIGLEWAHRLLSEPRRLWRRYLVGNLRFAVALLKQAITIRRSSV